jgi:serine protease Do
MTDSSLARRFSTTALLLAIPLACARPSSSGAAKGDVAPEAPEPPTPVEILPHPTLTAAGGPGQVSIADIAEKVTPSVVNISLTKESKSEGPGFFPFFFGPPDNGPRREQGMGSGVIVSPDGYILTNNHVVADANEIKVTLSDKREFLAEVVGTDPKSDVAVIKLKGSVSGLRAIEIGDSAALRLGDVVLAIGNPFGVGQTVTMGIVSAKGRADVGIVDYEDFIQTDAAINPGNSGGALVNMQGRLVGINTAILSRSGGFQGIGFAIPTNMAKPIMESLKKYGKVTRGWLGVSIQDVDQDLASTMKLPTSRGVLIADVQADSPAAKGGIRRGDVIVKIDGREVETTGQLRNVVASAGARKVPVEFYRDGKRLQLSVSLGEAPAEAVASAGGVAPGKARGLDGLGVGELTPEARKMFNLGDDVTGGVVITGIERNSPAARAGIRPGDVVLEVNRTAVKTVKEFEAAFAKAKGNVLFLLHRRGATVFLVLRR